MEALVFSLGAAQSGGAPEFTKEERDELLKLAQSAIESGAVRDYGFAENGKRRELLLKNGDWEAAPTISFSKLAGRSGTTYLYSREGGDHISTQDFARAVQSARSDLEAFGQQVHAEQQKSASNTVAARQRSQFRVIKAP